MARTADITVSVPLAIILNSADHKEVRELQTIRYTRNVTAPFCIDYRVGVSNPGRIILSMI